MKGVGGVRERSIPLRKAIRCKIISIYNISEGNIWSWSRLTYQLESAACLNLSFHVCINLPSLSVICYRKPPTFHALDVFGHFLQETLSEWRHLCAENLQVSIDLISTLSSIFHRAIFLVRQKRPVFPRAAAHLFPEQHRYCFWLACYFSFRCILCPLPSTSQINPLWQHGSDWSSIRLQTLFPHEQSISVSAFTLSFRQTHFFFLPLSQIFHSLLHLAFHGMISQAFKFPSLLLSPWFFFYFVSHSPPSHPLPSYLAELTAADVPRPQTSASHVLLCWSD